MKGISTTIFLETQGQGSVQHIQKGLIALDATPFRKTNWCDE